MLLITTIPAIAPLRSSLPKSVGVKKVIQVRLISHDFFFFSEGKLTAGNKDIIAGLLQEIVNILNVLLIDLKGLIGAESSVSSLCNGEIISVAAIAAIVFDLLKVCLLFLILNFSLVNGRSFSLSSISSALSSK